MEDAIHASKRRDQSYENTGCQYWHYKKTDRPLRDYRDARHRAAYRRAAYAIRKRTEIPMNDIIELLKSHRRQRLLPHLARHGWERRLCGCCCSGRHRREAK